MADKPLVTIAPELFKRLEERDSLGDYNRQKVVNDFFTEFEKTEEMAQKKLTPGYYTNLRDLVITEVLPLYAKYANTRDTVRTRQSSRKIMPYIAGTVIAGEVALAILSHGRSLLPQVAIPTMAAESGIGAIIYGAMQSKDKLQLDLARKKLNSSVQTLDQALVTSAKYEAWKSESGSNKMLQAEALEVLKQYDDPQEFWRDYVAVRKVDPKTVQDKELLGIPRFGSFLKSHIEGNSSDVAREQRFNQLFLAAHGEFLQKRPGIYAIENLETIAKKNGDN